MQVTTAEMCSPIDPQCHGLCPAFCDRPANVGDEPRGARIVTAPSAQSRCSAEPSLGPLRLHASSTGRVSGQRASGRDVVRGFPQEADAFVVQMARAHAPGLLVSRSGPQAFSMLLQLARCGQR